MKTIAYCISNLIRYYISIVIRWRVEYKFLMKNVCVYMYDEKKHRYPVLSLKSIGTVENPIFNYGKVIPGKSNV